MVIEINDIKTIREIQEAFSTTYPYLSIHFFRRLPKKEDGSSQQRALIPVDTVIGNIKKTHVSGLLEIQPWNTIADVEKELLRRFGLIAQVLRKSDVHWILPEGAAHLTLDEQNETGQKASAHIIHPDYDTKIEDDEY